MRARSRHHGAKKTWCCGQRASVASVRTCQRLAVVGRASHTATVWFARGGPSLLPLAAQWRGEGNELTPGWRTFLRPTLTPAHGLEACAAAPSDAACCSRAVVCAQSAARTRTSFISATQ